MKSIMKNKKISNNISAYVMVFSLLAIGIIFGILTKGIFFSSRNLSMLARQTTVVGVLAIGMMFVIVAGHIDLSVGSLLGLCGTVAAVLQVWFHWGTVPTIIVTLLVGMFCGLWQGWWIAYRNVPAFIITLGGLLVFKGVKLGLSKSISISPMQPSFTYLGKGYLAPTLGWILAILAIAAVVYSMNSNRKSKIKYNFDIQPLKVDVLKTLGISAAILIGVYVLNSYQGVPIPVLIVLVLAILFTFVANKTVYGRSVYSIGGNIEASSLSGIKTKRITLIIFIINGALCAMAGIMLTARLNAATAAAGNAMELDAIASCVIGGTSMVGGVGKIPGVIIGALIMASLDNGMSLINLPNYWQFIVKGLVLILAVYADTVSKKK